MLQTDRVPERTVCVSDPPHGRRFKLLASAIAAVVAAGDWRVVDADEAINPARYAVFNPGFFGGSDDESVDLSRFSRPDALPPGTYRLDLYVNERWMGRHELRVEEDGEGEAAAQRYCFRPEQVGALGIELSQLPDPQGARRMIAEQACIELDRLVPEAQVAIDLSELSARLSIPQAYLRRQARGQVDPRDWDAGVTAAFIGYNASGYRNENSGVDSTQLNLGLNNGINLGNWRLRSNGNYNRSSQDGGPTRSHYSNASTYAQRDLTALRSQLTLGDYYTPGDLFDSVPFRGVQVGSDDRMLPDSQRGFAPVIRGVAETNARVTVRQGQSVLYETSVAPGPFLIDDLYDSGYSGDLEVTVSEADGRQRSFIVPYASVAHLLRPGNSRFNLTAGEYRARGLASAPRFAMGTYQRGISNQVSGYLGSIIAEKYIAAQVGVALSTDLGALAFDATQSRVSELPESQGARVPKRGQSYRVTYSKLVDATRTSLSVAAYRYSSEGYLEFGDYAQFIGDPGSTLYRQRSRLQANLSQPLGERYGNLYLSGSAQNYWNTGQSSDLTYQAGYSNGFNWGSIGVSAARTRMGAGYENQYLLSFSVPLGRGVRAPYLSTSVNHSSGRSNGQASLSGSLGERAQASYSLYGSVNRDRGERSSSGGASAHYRAAAAELSAGYSQGTGYRQQNLGISGSLVAHPGGINLSQSQGDTLAIVEAKGAEGAYVSSDAGARVGPNGYAVVGNLTPYRRNHVVLDPVGTLRNVELQITEQSVAPRHGAVVMLSYPTIVGAPVLLHILREDGQNPPLGSEVLDGEGRSLALVGQAGRAFLRGIEPKGVLRVRWGEGADKTCRLEYQLPEVDPSDSGIQQVEVRCVSLNGRSEIALVE
ncbi:fimbrial biogenesis outer membrane usher protein [Metapseudomonas furukawaii]|uniref:fimbria/pilus outer membrane usher protein n=1 Tax=Metapseudomonas furukawaii TaxID=1149133 RepID=UPI00227D0CBB|nr:fimbria/pilus outer membrane usher protein [Pseudomonas furukawaii]WAG79497.1 fimbrial biogenesis outer membrane usher protein [Pseudomonas furukawaii]